MWCFTNLYKYNKEKEESSFDFWAVRDVKCFQVDTFMLAVSLKDSRCEFSPQSLTPQSWGQKGVET